MKKIISLTIPILLMAVLFTVVIIVVPATLAVSASAGINGDIIGQERGGPPWYDEAWNYRRPINISNSGYFLSYYQVMIEFNNSNFNFNLAKADGSDIRFTDSSGRNPLLFWIESWDKPNQLAYLWVLVSSLPQEPIDTTIYVYFNNPNAQPIIDGQSPFDFFDDNWCQFPGSGCKLTGGIQQFSLGNETNIDAAYSQLSDELGNYFDVEEHYSGYTISNNSWITLTTQAPSVTGGVLTFNNGVGIRTSNPFQYTAVGFRANYGLGTGHEWAGFIDGSSGLRTMIGDLPTDVDDLYLINFENDDSTILEGLDDWHNSFHIYEVRWKPGESIGDIDHGISTDSNLSQVPNVSLPVTLYNNNSGSNTTLKVDWVYVRQYRDPEPISIVGAPQGLVELSIDDIDSPDPIRKNTRLTYLLTISNTSSIDAPGVMVTDTLPANIILGPISSSRGSCVPGSVILCDLNSIPANSTATITIIVTPTVDGIISNFTAVGSPGFEIDLSDNTNEQTTLVDSIPPVVIWQKPVQNGQIYVSLGGMVILEASATDNSGQVGWVEYRLWDHIGLKWVTVGFDDTYPFQVQFNSDILHVNQLYQMYVVGVDRAGNESDPYNPLQVIYIERRIQVYLPS